MSWQSRLQGGRETLISLAEVTGALQEGSCCILKPFAVKMHFPRCCFMSKEGGHKRLFEL